MERWEKDAIKKSFVSKGVIGKFETTLILPQTFMNNSGESLKGINDSEIAKDLIVIHDDIDLPFGTIRIYFSAQVLFSLLLYVARSEFLLSPSFL